MATNKTLHKNKLDEAIASNRIKDNDVTYIKDTENKVEGIVLGKNSLVLNTIPDSSTTESGKLLQVDENGSPVWGTNIGDITGSLETLTTEVNTNKSNIISNRGKVDNLKIKIGPYEQRIQESKVEIDNIKTQLGDINQTTISSIQSDIQELQDNYTTMSDSLGAHKTEFLEFKNLKGVPNGLAMLDAQGKIPSSQLPSYVDDVITVDNEEALPETGEDSKIYITKDTNTQYRWDGSFYVSLNSVAGSLTLGETSSTAYAGDKGKANRETLNAHIANKTNPHEVTKGQVGLGNVDNTRDLDKPISTAVQTALDKKVNAEEGKGLSTQDFTTSYKDQLDNLEGKLTSLQETKVNKDGSKVLSDNNYTTAEKTKLAGIAAGANNYVLPEASTNVLGGVILDNILSTSSKHAITNSVVTIQLNSKMPKSGGIFTGNVYCPTAADTDNSTRIATTAYVQSVLKKKPVLDFRYTQKSPLPYQGLASGDYNWISADFPLNAGTLDPAKCPVYANPFNTSEVFREYNRGFTPTIPLHLSNLYNNLRKFSISIDFIWFGTRKSDSQILYSLFYANEGFTVAFVYPERWIVQNYDGETYIPNFNVIVSNLYRIVDTIDYTITPPSRRVTLINIDGTQMNNNFTLPNRTPRTNINKLYVGGNGTIDASFNGAIGDVRIQIY